MTEPLLAGIYAGDTAELSLKATFPQFMEMEQRHRSLILGLLASKKQPPPKPLAGLPKAASSSMFLTLQGGLTVLTDALADALQGERVITGQAVTGLNKKADRYELELSGGERLEADGVIVATPALLRPACSMSSFLHRPAWSKSATFRSRIWRSPIGGKRLRMI
ncbi:hypothetical protein HMSSN139_22300 [Paenibacillus sp. HMSSN-139]|nr:hypothetical protein HMSSN139_22300 [Paenibacillus sp. HMSSN-139]